jgi:hypothetical protein
LGVGAFVSWRAFCIEAKTNVAHPLALHLDLAFPNLAREDSLARIDPSHLHLGSRQLALCAGVALLYRVLTGVFVLGVALDREVPAVAV